MERKCNLFGNSGCNLNRREFLGGCAACAAGLAGLSLLSSRSSALEIGECDEKAKVRLVFTHRPTEEATWPNAGYDHKGRKAQLTKKFRSA